MKKGKRKWSITFIPILFIILFVLGVFYYSYEFNCGDDVSCYNRHIENCKRTKLTTSDEGSTFVYQILGHKGSSCEIKVTLLEMPSETDPGIAGMFEGKSMTCLLSKNSEFNSEILPLCTGPLKESIYELTIQKMYNILAQSLGDIISGI
jgi:hypothetical protein